jgi:hypothetical protein
MGNLAQQLRDVTQYGNPEYCSTAMAQGANTTSDELLDSIGRRTGTDKSSRFHNFLTFYEQQLTGQTVHTMLEIGVKEGKGLMMWAEKFPCVAVVGMDIDVAKAYPGPYTVEYTDQASKPQLRSSIGELCTKLYPPLTARHHHHPATAPLRP